MKRDQCHENLAQSAFTKFQWLRLSSYGIEHFCQQEIGTPTKLKKGGQNRPVLWGKGECKGRPQQTSVWWPIQMQCENIGPLHTTSQGLRYGQ